MSNWPEIRKVGQFEAALQRARLSAFAVPAEFDPSTTVLQAHRSALYVEAMLDAYMWMFRIGRRGKSLRRTDIDIETWLLELAYGLWGYDRGLDPGGIKHRDAIKVLKSFWPTYVRLGRPHG